METVKNIRLSLGLTQAEMAKALGIGRSAFSMAEGGYRPLPDWAVVKMVSMHLETGEMAAPAYSDSFLAREKALEVQQKADLEKVISQKQKQLQNFQSRLTKMQGQYRQAQIGANQMAQEAALAEGIPTYEEELNQRRTINDAALLRFHPLKQRLLEDRIAVLEFEIARIEQTISLQTTSHP